MLAALQAFRENHNAVVATVSVAHRPLRARFDAARVANSPAAPAALQALGDALRASGYDNTRAAGPLASFALGFSADCSALTGVFPGGVVGQLTACGVAEDLGGRIRLHGAIMAAGPLLAFVRRDGRRSDRVYLGHDSLLLQEAVGHLVAGGERALELGAGPGLVACSLARAYRTVVATDLVAGLVGGARLTSYLNPRPPGHGVLVCVADVARGVRAGSFDFVAVNTPWVPSEAAQACLYADGGPTGMELPLRFLEDGCRLLRPGGVGVFLMTDLTYEDGRSPLAEGLVDAGLDSWVLTTPYLRGQGTWERFAAKFPEATAAHHVAVIVARPPQSATLAAAVDRLRGAWAEL